MASKFHQAQDIQGEVIELNRADGRSKDRPDGTPGKEWHAVDIIIEQRYPGKWNPDTREPEVWTQKLKLDRMFGTDEEIAKICKKVKARETEEIDGVVTTIAAGSEIQVKGYVGANRYKEGGEGGQWKTGSIAKVFGISLKTFDWQHFYKENTTPDDEEDEAPQVQRAPAPKPAPVATPSTTPTVSTSDLADSLSVF